MLEVTLHSAYGQYFILFDKLHITEPKLYRNVVCGSASTLHDKEICT